MVRLISLKEEELQEEINTEFITLVEEYNIAHTLVLDDPYIYYITKDEQDNINHFIHALQERAILFSVQKAQSIFIQPMNIEEADPLPSNVPIPEDDIDYPVVAVVDTSVKTDCTLIRPWLAGE